MCVHDEALYKSTFTFTLPLPYVGKEMCDLLFLLSYHHSHHHHCHRHHHHHHYVSGILLSVE